VAMRGIDVDHCLAGSPTAPTRVTPASEFSRHIAMPGLFAINGGYFEGARPIESSEEASSFCVIAQTRMTYAAITEEGRP